MATDIGVRIGIDGEQAFRSALNGVNAQIRNLNAEMRAAVTSMAGMDDAETSAAKKNDILARSIQATQQKISIISNEYDRAKAHLNELGDALDRAKREFGENSDQALEAQIAYNRQAAAVNRLGTQLNDATAELNRMQRELRQTEQGLDDVGDAADDASRDFRGLTTSFRDAFAGGAISGFIQSAISGIQGLVESTTEYRKITGTLAVSSQKAGYTAEQTAASYEQLYGVLGDEQSSATALANLQALGLSQENLTTLIDGSIGAWASYGDSIPIDGLAEAINETIRVGQVTGTFADLLNWAGTSEDEFNAKLAAAGTEAERVNLVLQEMANQGLVQAAEAWRTTNSDLVAANEAQAKMNESLSNLATAIAPGVTAVTNLIANAINGLMPVLESAQTYIAPLVENMKTALSGVAEAFQSAFTPEQQKTILSFLENLGGTLIAVPFGLVATAVEVLSTALQFLIEVGGAVVDFFAGLPDGVIAAGTAFDDFKEAVAKSVTEALENVTQWGQDLLSTVSAAASGAVETVSKFFSELPGNIQQFVSDALSKVVTWASDLIVQAQTAGEGFLSGVGDFLTLLPGNVAEWIAGAVESVITWGETMKTKAGQKMQEMKDAIKNTLASLPNDLLAIGKNVVQGFINGLLGKLAEVKAAAQSLATAVTSRISSALNMHSPSRVLIAQGEDAGGGFAIGLENSVGRTSKAALANVKAVTKAFAGNITAPVPTPTAYADHMAQLGSGVVNGIQSAVAGMRTGSTYTFNLMLPDGAVLARYQLPALIDVARANGTPILNPM